MCAAVAQSGAAGHALAPTITPDHIAISGLRDASRDSRGAVSGCGHVHRSRDDRLCACAPMIVTRAAHARVQVPVFVDLQHRRAYREWPDANLYVLFRPHSGSVRSRANARLRRRRFHESGTADDDVDDAGAADAGSDGDPGAERRIRLVRDVAARIRAIRERGCRYRERGPIPALPVRTAPRLRVHRPHTAAAAAAATAGPSSRRAETARVERRVRRRQAVVVRRLRDRGLPALDVPELLRQLGQRLPEQRDLDRKRAQPDALAALRDRLRVCRKRRDAWLWRYPVLG